MAAYDSCSRQESTALRFRWLSRLITTELRECRRYMHVEPYGTKMLLPNFPNHLFCHVIARSIDFTSVCTSIKNSGLNNFSFRLGLWKGSKALFLIGVLATNLNSISRFFPVIDGYRVTPPHIFIRTFLQNLKYLTVTWITVNVVYKKSKNKKY